MRGIHVGGEAPLRRNLDRALEVEIFRLGVVETGVGRHFDRLAIRSYAFAADRFEMDPAWHIFVL